MSPREDGLELAKMEYPKLRDEIADLKRCQITILHYTLLLVGGFLALIGAASKAKEPEEVATPVCLIACTFVSLALVVFAWLIYHKSASAFRIIAWCRIIEGFAASSPELEGKKYPGYETAYVSARLIHRNWRKGGYASSRSSALKPDSTAKGRIEEQEKGVGNYYLWVVGAIAGMWLMVVVIGFYLYLTKPCMDIMARIVSGLCGAVCLGAFLRILWLFFRELKRLKGRPYSIQSWYEVFLLCLPFDYSDYSGQIPQ